MNSSVLKWIFMKNTETSLNKYHFTRFCVAVPIPSENICFPPCQRWSKISEIYGVNYSDRRYFKLWFLDNCCGHTAIFLLHKMSKTSKWLTNLAHNLTFQYDRTFAARNFYSINTSKSFVFGRCWADFFAQFYSISAAVTLQKLWWT